MPAGDRTPAQRLGDAAEAVVAERLISAGWTILERNVRVGRDELDLIASDPGPPAATVIVEVRWRASRAFGLGEESVDGRKRSRLRRAGWRWLDEHSGAHPPMRFDLVVVEPGADGGPPAIRHHRAAF